MSRVLLIALLAMAAALATVGVASADVGDLDDVNLEDSDLESDDDQLTVEGDVLCEEDDVEYGILVKVTGQDEFDADGTFLEGDADEGPSAPTGDDDVEAVGAFGPAFEGVQDDQSCDENTQDFDVTVAANDGSEEFDSTDDYEIEAVVGTSANDGANGPGPIIGDMEIVSQVADIE